MVSRVTPHVLQAAALLAIGACAISPVLADERAKHAPLAVAGRAKAAVAAGDDAALDAILQAKQPDPWIVVEVLLSLGDGDVARTLAARGTGPDLASLRAHVENLANADVMARHRLVARVKASIRAKDSKQVMALTEDLEDGVPSVADATLWHLRARAIVGGGDVGAAIEPAKKSIDIAKSIGWLRGAAEMADWIAMRAGQALKFRESIELNETLEALCKARDHPIAALHAQSRIGRSEARLGNHQHAKTIFESVIRECEAIGAEGALVATVARGDLATVLEGQGELRQAVRLYRTVTKSFMQLGRERLAATSMLNQGAVEDSMGRGERAVPLAQRAVSIFEKLNLPREHAMAVSHLGTFHHGLGDYAKAIPAYEAALAVQESVGAWADYSGTLMNLAGVYSDLGDAAKAIRLVRRCQEIATRLGDRRTLAVATQNLGMLLGDAGEVQEAIALYDEAVSHYESIGLKDRALAARANMGNTLIRAGELDRAIEMLSDVHAQLTASGHRTMSIACASFLGDAYIRSGKLDKAISLLEQAVRGARRARTRHILLGALKALAKAYFRNGETIKALEAARQGIPIVEEMLGGLDEEHGAQGRESVTELFSVGTRAAMAEGRLEDALTFLESGRAGALLDALGKRETLNWKAESLSEELQAADHRTAAQLQEARKAYAHAVESGARKAIRTAARALDAASDAVRAVSGRIQRALKQQASLFYPRSETLDGIQAVLEPSQAMVLYALPSGRCIALVIEPNDVRTVDLGDAVAVAEACAKLDAHDPEANATLAKLRAYLVAPLKLEPDVRSVLVSPEGPLSYLPFGALFEQPVTMTPSGTTHVLLADMVRDPGEGILAIGGPDYAGTSQGAQRAYFRGKSLAALPGAEAEVRSIGTKTLVGPDASEPSFAKALASQSSWRAVHFACHGLVNTEKPLLSSLALTSTPGSDGFFTALEVLRSDIPADLAVLSACETGRGRLVGGEGIVGLTRAFMFAGAPRVICSLWKVDDEATRALMVKFYELWNGPDPKKRLGAAQALQKAQAFVRGHEKWEHPSFWAAWVLWGLPE